MKQKHFFDFKIAIAILFIMILQTTGRAQTIKVSEDTYVYGAANTDVNYGSGVEAAARDTLSSVPRISYFKFPLSSVTATSVTNAKIKFFVYLPSSTAVTEILQIHKVPKKFGVVANDWSESTVTYTTRPRVIPTPITEVIVTSVPVASPNNYTNFYEVDVTAYLNEALAAGDTDISIAIKAKPKVDGGKDKQVRLGTREALPLEQYSASITYTPSPLGVNDLSSLNPFSLQVYPNPIKAMFSLTRTFNSSDLIEVAIYDVLGAQVAKFKEAVNTGVWSKELDAQALNMNKGVYIIKVLSQSNGNSVSKVIVD